MNKLEYLKQLENALKGKISADELNDIIRDYAEYFEEGKKQGKTEDAISQKLGIPFEVAQQILNDEDEVKDHKKGSGFFQNKIFSNISQTMNAPRPPKPPKEPKEPKQPREPRPPKAPVYRSSGNGCLQVFLTLMGFLILLPFALMGVAILFSVLVAIFACGLALGAAGIASWIAVSVCSAFLPPLAIVSVGLLGMALIAICITIGIGICWAMVSFCKAISDIFGRHLRKEPIEAAYREEAYWEKAEPAEEPKEQTASEEPQQENEEGDDRIC